MFMKDSEVIALIQEEEYDRVEQDYALRKELDHLWEIVKLLRNDVATLQAEKALKLKR